MNIVQLSLSLEVGQRARVKKDLLRKSNEGSGSLGLLEAWAVSAFVSRMVTAFPGHREKYGKGWHQGLSLSLSDIGWNAQEPTLCSFGCYKPVFKTFRAK